jgi:hypothetical protein
MSVSVEPQRRDIDIVKVLDSAAMVGMYRGKEVWNQVEIHMDEVADNTLVLIDIRGANPLQYEFCQYAFGPLLENLNSDRWLQKYVVFRMHDFHKPGFFRGILKHLGTDLPRKESESRFVSAGFYAKLIVGDEQRISFIGALNENQVRTLDVVNELIEATARQVVEKLGLPEEMSVDALRFLVRNYFVAMPAAQTDVTHYYYSFYKYLGKE